MTRAQIIQLIRDRLGFHKSMSEEIILRHMDLVQSFYENGADLFPLPWFTLKTDFTLNTVVGQRTLNFPEDFVSIDEDWPPVIFTEDGSERPLERESFDQLKGCLSLNGFPRNYALTGGIIHLFPIPDKVYTIQFPYHQTLAPLSTTQTGDWFKFFPNLLVEEVTLSIARAQGNEFALANTQVTGLRVDYRNRVEAMKHVGMNYVMGQ